MGWTSRDSNHGRSKRFFSPPKHPGCLWGPLSLLFIGYQGVFLGLKWPVCEVGLLPSCSAKVYSFSFLTFSGFKLEYPNIDLVYLQYELCGFNFLSVCLLFLIMIADFCHI